MPYQPKPGAPIEGIDTPALLLDLDAFQRNLDRMAGFFADRPVSLRPHAKTHKCPEIALRQLGAGAIGITCAKLGEAEVMAQSGITDILIANQIVGPIKVNRLTQLGLTCDLIVAVDYGPNIAELSESCETKGVALRVLVEVDVGMGRCGVESAGAALALARQVADAPGLRFAGLMGYEGHLVMLPDPEQRLIKVREATGKLQEAYDLLQQHGLTPEIVSGGGTGTYDMTGTCAPMTEIQAGSYVLMDTTYLKIRPEFEPALTVLSTVVSRPTGSRIVTDSGLKTVSKEFGWPQVIGHPGVAVQSLSEEHGKLSVMSPESVTLEPGNKIQLIPSHVCTTINLHDNLYITQGGQLVDIWPIAARGRAQ